MKNFISKYPRVSSLVIGFALGLVVVLINNQWAKATITEYKEIASKREKMYEEVIEKSQTKIESLSKINENLKKQVKMKKVTLPDGTITEETDTNINSSKVTETQIRTSIEKEYQKKLEKETESYRETITTLTNRKLRLGVGYTFDGDYVGHLSYDIYGAISIGGGMTSSNIYFLDVGISL